MQDHNDIYSIVERLRILEEGLTPTTVKHGLNKQQKSVDQLSATFKPKTVAVLTAKTDPKNPMAGKLVGGSESIERDEEALEEAVATEDVLDRVKQSFADYLKTVADEIKQDTDLKNKKQEDTDLKKKDKQDRDLIAKEKEVDESELGSALSGIVPAEQPAGEEGVSMKEDPTENNPEPTVSASPTVNPVMPESAAVKTVTNECGLWEIHGNEPTGFEIRFGNRPMRSKFNSIEEAVMALEMFAARKRAQDESQDYIEEA